MNSQPSYKRTVKKYKFNFERRAAGLSTAIRKHREAIKQRERAEIRNKQVRAEFRKMNLRPTIEA